MQKNTVYLLLVVLFYPVFMVLSSCEQPTSDNGNHDVEDNYEETVQNEDDINWDDSAEDDADDINDEPEDNPEEEEEKMQLQPFEEYDKYFLYYNRLRALDGQDIIKRVPVLDSDGNEVKINQFYQDYYGTYISVIAYEQGDKIEDTDPVQYETVEVEYFFKQSDGTIEEIEESDFNIPVAKRVVVEEDGFSISTQIWNDGTTDVDVSKVTQGTAYTNFFMIDGYYINDIGMWISVPEGPAKTAIKPGIYFYPKGINRIGYRSEYSRIY